MNSYLNQDLEEMDEISVRGLKIRNIPRPGNGKKIEKKKGGKLDNDPVTITDSTNYQFSYQASRYEREWLMDSIADLYQQDWIDDIIRLIRGGKEASVYLCRAPESMDVPLLAAKVYRPRRFRNLKNDHVYREGRDHIDATGKLIKDDRSLHAMGKRTGYGLKLLHSSWIGHEYRTMQILHKAGVDIPRPHASSDNVILMEYVGDELTTAPTLNSVSLTSSEAEHLFERVIYDIELMLRFNRVHADLSAYNILYWSGDIKLIDFPQAIDPDENHNAYRIFCRDVTRVCDYFASQGVKVDPQGLSTRLWKQKNRLINPALDPQYLDPENEDDVRLWKRESR